MDRSSSDLKLEQALAMLHERSPAVLEPVRSTSGSTLAWGSAYVLEGLLRWYRRTERLDVLARFESLADACLAVRDSETGTEDHQGTSGPVWSVAGPYTVRSGELIHSDGAPALRLTTSLTRSNFSVDVIPETSPGSFRVHASIDGREIVLANLTTDPRSPAYAPRRLAENFPGELQLTAHELRPAPSRDARPVLRRGIELNPGRAAFAVHTARILSPMLDYVELFSKSRSPRSPDRLERYKAAAVAGWQHHSSEVVHTKGSTHLVFPRGAPIPYDGLALPHNMALAWAGLSARLRDFDTADGILSTFGADVRGVDARGLAWPYWWSGSAVYRGFDRSAGLSLHTPQSAASQVAEDISHGALSVASVLAAKRADARVSIALINGLKSTASRVCSAQATPRTVDPADGDAPRGGSMLRWLEALGDGDMTHTVRGRAQEMIRSSSEVSGAHFLGLSIAAEKAPEAFDT